MFPHFQKYLNPQIRTSKLVNGVAYHHCPSRLASGMHLISLSSLGIYLSPEYLLNFPWLVYFTTCWKKFSIYGVHIPKRCIKSMNLYWCPNSPLKTPSTIFWKSVSPRSKNKGVEETMIYFIKIQSENMKMTWNICLLCMIYNFSKCNNFTVLWMIYIK